MPGSKHLPGASPRRENQYEEIKKSESAAGKPAAEAKRIAAATVNKQRAESGEAKTHAGKPNPKHK